MGSLQLLAALRTAIVEAPARINRNPRASPRRMPVKFSRF
jgi:hypothetical protein